MAIKILKQNEDGSYQWVNLTTGSGGGGGSLDELEVDYTDNNNTSNYTGDKSLVVTTPQTGTKRINIQYEGSVGANAYGRKYVQNSEPTSPNNGDIWYDTSGDATVSGITRIATVKDVKGSGVGGGDFPDNQWVVRDLNTLSDLKGIGIEITASETGNKISIPAGTYKIKWRAPGYRNGRHVSRLRYSNNAEFPIAGTTSVMGTPEINGTTSSTAGGDTTGVLGCVTFTDVTYIRIEHKCSHEYDNNGLGFYNDQGGDSIYTTLEIEDLSTAVKDAAPAPADVPIGGIIMWSGTKTALDALVNWVMCDNSAAAVAAGAPDLRDKFIIGADQYSSGWKTNVTGSLTPSGGSKDAVIVRHKHSITDPGHAHDIKYTNTHMNAGTIEESGSGESGTNSTESNTTGITDTDHEGVVGTDKNLPPYFALAYIMKIS